MSSSSSSSSLPFVTPRLFRALSAVGVNAEVLAKCSDQELRPALGSLVRMSLIASLDGSAKCSAGRTAVLQVLSRIELVNNLVALLSIDFHQLETDVRKEQQLRAKVGAVPGDSVLISNLTLGPALEFERSDATRRLRLVLSELLAIMGQVKIQSERAEEAANNGGSASTSSSGQGPVGVSKIVVKPSELFDHIVYLSEVCDVLAIAMAELPSLLTPTEVAEALLRLKYGPHLICHIVANQPDSFNDVAFALLKNGDKQDDDPSNRIRQEAILLLCEMNPSEIINIRSKCIEWCRMPSLAMRLTLAEHKKNGGGDADLVSFVSGLLLGSDPQIRSWIAYFVRTGQKRKSDALADYRKALQERLQALVRSISSSSRGLSREDVVSASALLRLYSALKGIAGMKFSEEEIPLLLDLITCRPPPTPAGIQFVSVGLCMLIASNSLISSPHLEKKAVDWIRWLVQEEDFFEQTSGVSASFGEMLLLMAIHFHSQQTAAVMDLVCQTLGMKIAIRTSSMNRMKAIFTQEIFTEQVVASHAVKVPVTNNLSSEIAGFLPVHCIHQLLKSRTFSKNKVPIKDWIYRQVCVSSTPLHPVLPALIEVFVNSILVPASNRGSHDQTNEPISEEEVRAVFANSKVLLSAPPSKSSSPFKSGSSSPRTPRKEKEQEKKFGLGSQVLMLYYILQYENVRLSHMRMILATQRKVLRYSDALLSSLPIKFLLKTAERDHSRFGVIFPQLLKLCSTQHPHLCLVQDWLEDEASSKDYAMARNNVDKSVSIAEVKEAFASIRSCPFKLTMVLEKLLTMTPGRLWQFAELALSHIRNVLEPETPRQIKELYKKLWFEFNKAFPRKLWVMTTNALMHSGNQTLRQQDLILDPLQVLRCDRRIFRVAPLLEVVLYVLKACLAASKTYLAQHLQENPIVDRTGTAAASNGFVTSDVEREELRNALIATQDSAAIQILIEAGLPFDKAEREEQSSLSDLKEVRSLICLYLHEAFIADPTLAKLVHFQGYPQDLLSVTVAGVPSMHICLDFAPELLGQPDLDKQIFAVDLISHLSVQYALPKSYSTARLAVNAISTLLSVLSMEERNTLFPPVLPAFVRFCKAFPPLVEDVIGLLIQYGKISVSESCLKGYSSPKNFDMSLACDDGKGEGGAKSKDKDGQRDSKEEMRHLLRQMSTGDPLPAKIQETFEAILENSVMDKKEF